MSLHRKGSIVHWKWGKGEGEGKIIERHDTTITKTIKGSEITRKGTKDNPAYLIEQEDGTLLLKLASELK